MTPEERDRLSRLEARHDAMEQKLDAIARDTRETRDAIMGAKGGWKTIAFLIGGSSAIGALIAKFASYFHVPT